MISVVPADSVGNRVGKVEVLGESASGDLEIIIGVTPSTHSARGGRIEDRGIGELRAGVCRQKRYKHNWILATGGERQRTNSPVPVGLSSLVVAFGLQSTLEVGDKATMPRQEEASEMDLGGENIRVS